jgi:hypothetical protein
MPKGFPGFQLDDAGFDRRHAPFNFNGPGRFGVGIRWAIQAGEQLGGQFGPGVNIKAQGVGEDSLNGLRHSKILRLDSPPNKRLQPTEADATMSRRG